MKLSQGIRMGAWILAALNLIMAFGSIWIFMRMAPAIEIIIEQNERSLYSCEEMLSHLALANQSKAGVKGLQAAFSKALERAKNNITETAEPAAIEAIGNNYIEAFAGSIEAKKKTISAIHSLSEINRGAMVKADRQARQLGHAGAWGIVFMASAVFIAGILFMRGLQRNVIKPLEEIYSVIQAIGNGDSMRRCTGADMPQDIKSIFSGINEVLDKNTPDSLIATKR
jgi:hypothetical protein